ncbi:MAG: type IV secretory system conjugative DNA transfer family protein, partial [Candidatus Micrarchaeota archaeon]
LGGALTQFNNPAGNKLVPLRNDGYPAEIHVDDVLERQTHRSGMLLNRDELVNFVHFPDSSIRTEKLLRNLVKTKKAPAIAHNHQLVLGTNTHQGEITEVTLSPDQRMRHMYVVGASGTGKSTLLLNLIIQDIHFGQGLAVLDPHGDLIDQILDWIPKNRKDDVILFNPADEDYPIPFNIFSAASETEKTLLASDLTGVFRRLSSSWGDQMNAVLANGILAMLESSQGATLMTLRRFLIEKPYRNEFLKTVQDQEIVYYWEKEFPLLSGRPQASVLTRLDTFLRPKPIRHMVGQKDSRIDFAHIMNNRKIFLAKLSHGGIGEENSYLLGALLVAKIHQIALSRQEIEQKKRQPFYLYIDEFQNFVTPSMESILSGARKYNLGLILAHQELRQLAAKDKEVASSVLSNPYTRICFRLGETDAAKLAAGFSYFDGSDLQSLGIGQAIGRIEQARYDFNLRTHDAPRNAARGPLVSREEIIAASRANYGVPL